MAPLKTEINLKRLLGQCEKMASKAQENDGIIEWRLEKYVEALQTQYSHLSKEKGHPDADTMIELKKKIDFLTAVVKSGKKDTSMNSQIIFPNLPPLNGPLSQSNQVLPSTSMSKAETEIGLQAKGRYARELKAELLGDTLDDSTGLRNRRSHAVASDDSTADNIDDIMKHHHEAQEKVAENMIRMAQDLKHNSMAASDIIKKDTDVLTNASKLAETNNEALKIETERLESHNRRYCSLWIWILLAIVLAIYFFMILLIVFIPKRK